MNTLLVLKWFLGLLGLALLAVIAAFIPWGSWGLVSHSHPAGSYAEAVRRIKLSMASQGADFNSECQARFLTHGQKVARVIILVHGYTNCPQQFAALGQQFFELGANVLILPLPHHGLADRMTGEHARLTADELAAYADQTVDIAQGLGERVIMLGLSAGGVATAWAAQNRSDLDLALIISPAFGFKQIPAALTAPAMNIYRLLPDAYRWWNPQLKLDTPPTYAYPRYSQHALTQTLRLGFAVRAGAKTGAPAAKKLIVVINHNDNSVNNELTAQVVKTWQAHGADVSTYQFAQEQNLGHDLIDPSQPNQQVELVYPRLIELAGQ